MTYESVPKDKVGVEGDREKLTRMLTSNPDNFYTAKTLAELSGYDTKGSQVSLRKAITELILDGLPIISTSEGFCYTTDTVKMQRYVESLRIRMQGIETRVKALERTIRKLSPAVPFEML